MNKDEMVEEMAKITNFSAFDFTQGTIKSKTIYTAMAEALYNAGYRKVADDEIVMSKEAYYDALNAAQESGKRMGYAQGRDETITAVLKYFDNTIKELNGANGETNKGLDEDEKKLESMCLESIKEVLKIVRDDLARIYDIELE